MGVTHKCLLEHCSYNLDTGQFIRHSDGAVLGYKTSTGYVQFGIGKTKYLAHRLAWYYIHGKMPVEVDHINGDRTDNRLCNLREVSHAENMQNQKLYITNKSGFPGVSFDKATAKWRVKVANKHIGLYSTLQDAEQARLKAITNTNYHTNHGRTQ